MFGFILGFILGGVTGAALAMALSPSYRYEGEETGTEGAATAKARAAEIGEMVKVKVREAIEEGKRTLQEAIAEGRGAAAKKTSELEQIIRRTRGDKEKEVEA